MIQQILSGTMADGWARLGITGSVLLAISQWLVVQFGTVIGTLSAIGGFVVIMLTIIKTSMDIFTKYRDMKAKDDDLDESEKQD